MRCNYCKEKFDKQYRWQMGKLKFCLRSDDCKTAFSVAAKQKNEQLQEKKRTKITREKKEKLKTWMDYVKELEIAFNAFIRERDNQLPCISCNALEGSYKLTAGHFYPTTYQYLRFNEDNVHGQCWYNCNKNKRGNLSEYRPRLIEKIGIERVKALDDTRHNKLELSIPEIQKLKKVYRKKITELKLRNI